VGNYWAPLGVSTIDPLRVPLLNTVILLTSGGTVTVAHFQLLNRKSRRLRILVRFLLGLYFRALQLIEYKASRFSIEDRVYGNLFFMATGFHGIHIIVGSIYLIVNFIWSFKFLVTQNHHVGFEMAAIYWHFVDVVWIFLYIFFYLTFLIKLCT